MVTREQVREVLIGLGFTFEHDWQESHGDGGQWTFQAPRGDATMIVSYDRYGQPVGLYPGENRDYRLAKEIRSNPEEYKKIRTNVSRCCTSSTDYFEDAFGNQFSIFGAAGHGEWAKSLGRPASKDPFHGVYNNE